MGKLAVVLFNLGGPDRPESVEPFLFNLFNDPAIIGAPTPIRWLLAKYISKKRAPIARRIYENLGGKSPLLEHTKAQADGLAERLQQRNIEAKVFIAMRYWHPMTAETVKAVKNWGADEVVLLPLYPQFSTTTSGSSINAWRTEADRQQLTAKTKAVCCYPTLPGFAIAQARLIKETLAAREQALPYRLLFSAHGLPERIIEKGDPYVSQIEQSAEAIIDQLMQQNVEITDWRVCYQSRVGRLKWVEPYTEDEIERAGEENLALLVVPIAFVSEHSETLVELDIEYRELAAEKGVSAYWRPSTVLSAPEYLDGLREMVLSCLEAEDLSICRGDGHGVCARTFAACPMKG
jgi:ferrochelatase